MSQDSAFSLIFYPHTKGKYKNEQNNNRNNKANFCMASG